MQVLESYTIETFAGRVRERFRLDLDPDGTVDLELVEVTQLGPAADSSTRAPFSLVFLGPTEPLLPQRIYPFEHGELGAFELFLVPIGLDTQGARYEAVFT